MKRPLLIIFGAAVFAFLTVFVFFALQKVELISPLTSPRKVDYSPYSFEYLQNRDYFQSQIKLEKVLEEKEFFTSYLFSYSADGRRITGMANIPKGDGQFPVAILIRGWVDEETYRTGVGTEKMAEFLAENGFLTLAPDLLGYGSSDSAFPDMLQTRFFRPITIITLLESLESLSQADVSQVVMWGHSNGGQIALSVLEISGRRIPTSLWAPVSAPFPESILHFVDELEDRGKLIKKIVADFESRYDSSNYSINAYFDQIEAPLIIHQGTNDEAIPLEWTDNLVKQLRELDKKVAYYQYPGENHNFHHGSAPIARGRDLSFFRSHLKN